MARRINARRSVRVVAGRAALVLIIILILALASPWLSFIEVRALDLLFALRPPRPPNQHIEIIDIGDDFDFYARFRPPEESADSGCEIPRLAYAEAVERLNRWGAKVIVFDMMFRRSCEFEDARLAQAFSQAGNVIVAASAKTAPGEVGLSDPVAPIDAAVWGIGSPVAHQPNETVRSVPLAVRDRDSGAEYLSLSLLGYQCFQGNDPAEMEIVNGRWLETADARIPLLTGERIHLLDFGGAGEPEAGNAGQALAIEVVSGENVEEIARLNTWNTLLVNWAGPRGTISPRSMTELLTIESDAQGRALYEGKAVIIGKIDWDVHWTALGAMPGLEIQANALQTLLDGEFIRPISTWGMLALLAAFILVTAGAVRRLKGARAIGAVVVVGALCLLIARQLLVARGLWMYLFYAELGILLCWGAVTVTESGKVTTMLARFVPSFIGKPEPTLSREVRSMDATMLFSDIRGFTSTAEQLSPVDMMKMLNTYHSAVEDIITKYGGTIVKTPGDAILAVFWKEGKNGNHAVCAVRSGQEILADVPRMARAWEAAGVKLAVGVGINSGEVAIGLVGKTHLEPTVIGDPVNVSQRLESLTKTLPYPLVLSESTHARIAQEVDTVFVDEVMVSGRKTPLKIYSTTEFEDSAREPIPSADKEKTE